MLKRLPFIVFLAICVPALTRSQGMQVTPCERIAPELSSSTRGVAAPPLLKRVEPAIPEALQKDPVPDSLGLQVVIKPDGTVLAVTVVTALANSAWGQLWIDAVKQWQYAPPVTTRGVPVYATVIVAITRTAQN